MPHDLNPNWGHVYEWLDLPPADDAERVAKEWLEEFVKPAAKKNTRWLHSNLLFCTYEGQPYRVTGASRFGDVWLCSDFTRNEGHEKRVDVLACSQWRTTPEVVDDTETAK